jgi:hypothetical protein
MSSPLVTSIIAAKQTALNALWTALSLPGSPPTLSDARGFISAEFDTVRGALIDAGDADKTIPNQKGGSAVVAFTTSSTQRLCTLGTLAANEERTVTVINGNGSGAGGVKLVANGAEMFLYNGAQYSNLYLRLPGRNVTLLGLSGIGWIVVSGEVSPVDNQPDEGGGLHYRYVNAWDLSARTDTKASPYTWDVSSMIPVGVRLVDLMLYFGASGTSEIAEADFFVWDYDLGASNISNTEAKGVRMSCSFRPTSVSTRVTQAAGHYLCSIGMSRKLKLGILGSAMSYYALLRGYVMGPA